MVHIRRLVVCVEPGCGTPEASQWPIAHSTVVRNSTSLRRPDCHAGTPPLEPFEGHNLDCSKPQRKHFQSCTSTCHRKQKLRYLCWYDYLWRTQWAPDAGKIGLLKIGTLPSNCERDWQEHVRGCVFSLGSARRINFVRRGAKFQVSGMTQGDDFVLTEPTERLTECENKMARGVSTQSKTHLLRVNGEHHSVTQKMALGKTRNCVSA